MLNETIPLKGRLQISLNGAVVREIDNLVVDTGAGWVAERIGGQNATQSITNMGIGTGTAVAAAGDTGITTAQTQALATTTVDGAAKTVVFSATFPGAGAGNSAAVTEAGLLTGDATPILVARTVFNVVNKDEDDEMTITWTITISGT